MVDLDSPAVNTFSWTALGPPAPLPRELRADRIPYALPTVGQRSARGHARRRALLAVRRSRSARGQFKDHPKDRVRRVKSADASRRRAAQGSGRAPIGALARRAAARRGEGVLEAATAAGETPHANPWRRSAWTDNTVARLRQLWAEGHSTAEIGRRLGVSKNAVIGKAHRLDLSGRQSPIKPTGLGRPPSHPRRSPVPKLADIMPLKTCTAASSGPAAPTRPCPTPAKQTFAGAKTARAGRVQAVLLALGRPRHGGVPVLRPNGADRQTILRSALPRRVHPATSEGSRRPGVRPTMSRRHAARLARSRTCAAAHRTAPPFTAPQRSGGREMGWLFHNEKLRHETPVQYITREFSHESETAKATVLAAAAVRGTIYAAVRNEDKTTGKTYVFCAVILFKNSERSGFGYKDMDESCGPCEVDCPDRIMRLLSPVERNSRPRLCRRLACACRREEGASTANVQERRQAHARRHHPVAARGVVPRFRRHHGPVPLPRSLQAHADFRAGRTSRPALPSAPRHARGGDDRALSTATAQARSPDEN